MADCCAVNADDGDVKGDDVFVDAVLKKLSKLSTLKCAAAADSAMRNVWCDGDATRVSSPSMIMAVAGGPGATPPLMKIKENNCLINFIHKQYF